jgi:DNA-binding MarR family transcriptional regulator
MKSEKMVRRVFSEQSTTSTYINNGLGVSSENDIMRFTAAFRKLRRGSAVRKLEALTLTGHMTLEEIEILLIVAEARQPCRMGELALRSDSKPANVARSVKQLVVQNLVIRSCSGADGRGAVVTLTKSGQNVAKRVRNREHIVEALEDLSIALEDAVAKM